MDQRDLDRQHARKEIYRERKSIHFGVERDDEGLHQPLAGRVLPACGREEVIEQPGRDNDHQNRVGPQLQPFAVATGHRLTSFSVDSRSLLAHRSEEHTSELQSLMRISYAVFCLKKKIITDDDTLTN